MNTQNQADKARINMTRIMTNAEIMDYLHAVSQHEAAGHKTAQEVTTSTANMAIDLIAKIQAENAALVAGEVALKSCVAEMEITDQSRLSPAFQDSFTNALIVARNALANLAAIRNSK